MSTMPNFDPDVFPCIVDRRLILGQILSILYTVLQLAYYDCLNFSTGRITNTVQNACNTTR